MKCRLLHDFQPWLPPACIKFLNGWLRPVHSILEFGSGGSTVFFSRRCGRVVSYESNPKWFKLVKEHVGENVHLSMNLNECLNAEGPFDMVFVDSDGQRTNRVAISRAAIFRVPPNGWFMLDNYGRYKIDFLKGWTITKFDHPGWHGKGTLLAKRPSAI